MYNIGVNMKSFVQKTLVIIGATGLIGLVTGSMAYAHVVVKPAEVPTASYQTFQVSVPNERDTATTKIKLHIPDGLTSVTPTVKSGWTIATVKTKDKAATVKSITWKSGSIDVGLRDEFTFSAKTPDKPVELHWKAYQTYQDGTVVAWDSADSDTTHGGTTGPFSVTKVTDKIDDQVDNRGLEDDLANAKDTANMALYIGVAGLIIGLISIYFGTRRR